MEQYYRPLIGDDGDFDTTRFSGFVEFQKPGIKQAITVAGFDFSDFATWIHEGKLFPLQKVRVLPRILRNEKARESSLSTAPVKQKPSSKSRTLAVPFRRRRSANSLGPCSATRGNQTLAFAEGPDFEGVVNQDRILFQLLVPRLQLG